MKSKLLCCLLLLIIPSILHAQIDYDNYIDLTFNTNLAGGTTVILPIDGNYDINIMWDNSTGFISSVNSDEDLTHTYASEGTYMVTIYGTVPHFGNTNGWTGADMLTDVSTFEPAGLTSLAGAFCGAVNLLSISLDIPSAVTDLSYLCYGASNLEGLALSGDLSNASNMSYMCYGTSSIVSVSMFAGTSGVTNMSYMFAYSNSFMSDIGNWDVSGVTDMTGMFKGTKLDETLYSDLINGWSKQTLQQNVALDAGSSCYVLDEESNRQKIIDAYNWTILDAGSKEMRVYVGECTYGTTVTLPLYGDDMNVSVKWTDSETVTYTTPGKQTHSYFSYTDRSYTLVLDGYLPQFGLPSVALGDMLLSIVSFGDIGTTSLWGACYNAVNLESVPNNIPGDVTDTRYMFYGAGKFSQDLDRWDVSNVNDMIYMFAEASSFNGNICDWDVSNVTSMSGMFKNAASFNQDIGDWDVSSVGSMDEMFNGAVSFNQDISGWDVAGVTSMQGMFRNTPSFKQNITNWNVSSVINMTEMFADNPDFNQDISGWNVSSVYDFGSMFENDSSFNQDIGNWNIRSNDVMTMNGMFKNAVSFNQDISGWDVSAIDYMNEMFAGASSFNQDISTWDVADVNTMASMFSGATSFDQDLSAWKLTSVTDMSNMFEGVTLSSDNYSNMLIEWSKQSLKSNVTFDGGNSTYNSEATVARQSIIDNYGWTITDGGEALPVELTFFNGELSGNEIILNWETIAEVNNYGFEIERKHQNSNNQLQEPGKWIKIGFVNGDGSSNSTRSYSFIDENLPSADELCYRLKQIDNDGHKNHSKLITVNISGITGVETKSIPEEFGLSQNYPNPFNPVTQIKYQIAEDCNVTLKVYSVLGKEIFTLVNKNQSPGYYNVEFNGSGLASGIYLYQLKAGSFIQTKKLLLVK